MSEQQLETLWHVTLACNWMDFEDFVDMVGEVTDNTQILSWFKITVH